QALGSLPAGFDAVSGTVSGLLSALGAAKTLAVRLGDSSAVSTSTATSVAADSRAAGGHIDLLPNSTAFGAYAIRLGVGSSGARAPHDRVSGAGASSADPALVRVLFSPGLLGGGLPPIEVAPGQSVTVLDGTPLETTITAATSKTFTLADGSMGSVA